MMLMNDMAIGASIVDGKKTPSLAPEFQRPVGSVPPAQPAHLAYWEPHAGEPRYLRMDISFTIVVLLLVFMIATAIGFAWTGFSRR